MSKYHFPIPGHEDDKIVIFTRRHIVSMLGTILLILFMFLMPIIIFIIMLVNDRSILSGAMLNFLVVGGSIYYLVVVTFAFVEWVSYYYDIFIVTEDEIVDISQEGIFNRKITEVTLLRVQDVSAQIKGFLPTIFSYGDVVAESAGENTRTYIIDGIPDPVGVANKILEMHNEHIDRQASAAEIATGEGGLRVIKPCPPIQPQGEFQQAIQRDMQAAQANPQTQPPDKVCPPCPPTPTCPPTITPPPTVQGEVKKDDLNQGGEVKF